MSKEVVRTNPTPVLLCFDGSDDAAHAIAHAGRLLGPRQAVVLSVWEPVAVWQPYDPATAITAPISRLASSALGLDEIARDLAQERATAGVEMARRAGFDAQSRIAGGKPWRVICNVADEIEAEPIVLGARGLSRVQSALIGSVSAATVQHARHAVLVVPRHADSASAERAGPAR
jgi:nucleotide-binding universal stress UspA family protein